VLSNAIDQAWYKHKVVTLISFDLKGAFNGVNGVSLDAGLQARGIPMATLLYVHTLICSCRILHIALRGDSVNEFYYYYYSMYTRVTLSFIYTRC
jgi:hypothetical protein